MMKEQDKNPVSLLFGGAAKSSFQMNEGELKIAAAEIKRRAKEKAFSKGLPIYSYRNGALVADYPDGSTKVVE